MSELSQADLDAMLIAEAVGHPDPSVWEHFMKKWSDDIKRRIDEHYPAVASTGGTGESS